MATLQTTTITTSSDTSDLLLKTGNTTGPQIVIAANGQSLTLRGNSVANSFFVNTSSVYFNGALPPSPVLTNLTATGSVVISGNVTPTIITSNTSAWNPGTSNVYVIRLQANAAGTASNTALYEAYISGLVAGTNGQVIILSNIGSQKIQLRNEDAINETTAANRFNLPNHVWLAGAQSMKIIYDGTLARWRPMNSLLIAMDHKETLTKGFWGGGATAPATTLVTTVEKITYSSETSGALTSGASLSQARISGSASGNADKGFFYGASNSPTTYTATTDRVTNTTEAIAAVSGANLTTAKGAYGSAGNTDKGFSSGGQTPTELSSSDRTTYSNETTAVVSGAALSQVRKFVTAVGNVDKGFFCGGLSGSTYLATADRTRYSTETNSAVSGANLSQARAAVGPIGNQDKGFFAGGNSGVPFVVVVTANRITYASETTAAVAGANLSVAREPNASGAGNSDKGFIVGGFTGAGPLVATADKIDYSNDTRTAIAGANLGTNRGAGVLAV